MTAAEREELRLRIDEARRSAVAEPPNPECARDRVLKRRSRARLKRSAWCVYCGGRVRDANGARFALGLTCPKHADLPTLDWRYGGTTGEEVAA